MAIVSVRGVTYHMNERIKAKWDTLKDGRLAKYDEDRIYACDGMEGIGKSLFTLQQAAYIDPTILDDSEDGKEKLPRICFNVTEFIDAIRNNKSTKEHTKCIVFDEAFRGLSSKSALSKNNKLLVTALMEARQQNLVIFLVTPSFFMLEFYGAVLRTQALFHVVKARKTRQRYVRVFGRKQKALLYQIGIRKGWGYPLKTKFRINFFNIYPGGKDFEKRYRAKKSANFGVDDAKSKAEHAYFDKAEKMKSQRDILLYWIKKNVDRTPGCPKNSKLSYAKMSQAFKELGFTLLSQHMSEIVSTVNHKINEKRDLVLSKEPDEEDLPKF